MVCIMSAYNETWEEVEAWNCRNSFDHEQWAEEWDEAELAREMKAEDETEESEDDVE